MSDGLIIIGDRVVEVAFSAVGQTAVEIGGGVIGRQADRLVVIGDGALEIALFVKGVAARHERAAVIWIEPDRFGQIDDGAVPVALREAHIAAVGKSAGVTGVEPDGLREILERVGQVAFRPQRGGAVVMQDRKIGGLEAAGFDQRGARRHALVVAGAATALVVQHQAQTKLRDEGESLRQQIAQLQANNESLSNHLAAAADAKPSSAQSLPNGQSSGLLKLRGEVGVLQRQASEASQEAQVAEQKLATALSAKAQFASHQSAIINAAKQVGLAMRVFSGDHENQFPTNFLQLTNELGNSFSIRGIELFSFEFVNAGAVSLDHPNMVELRERLARQAPDGTWQRIYGFADGSVQTATSYDGNFDAWEKANTYSPPPNQ